MLTHVDRIALTFDPLWDYNTKINKTKSTLDKWKHQGKKARKIESPPGNKDPQAEVNKTPQAKQLHAKPIRQETPPKGLPNVSSIGQLDTLYNIQVETLDPAKVQR